MTTVELRQLGKVYPDGHVAVTDVDLVIDDGEFFVFVGPSGCGKTSILRMVAGLEEVTSGDVLLDGVSVGRTMTNERDLAMLFQTSALYPQMTVRENVGFPLKLAKIHKREIARRVEGVAARLGLTDVLEVKPNRLSGGQRQRVAMGRAIIREPRMLLMDEPMSNLDAKLRTELRADLAEMHRRLDVTTLLVTHDQIEAMSLGDRAAVMRSGRVVQCDTPQALYEHPADVFVAQFLGSPPMNVVLGRVVRVPGGVALWIGPQLVSLDAAGPSASIDRLLGRDVGVGIRPESLRLDPDGELLVEITHIERLGAIQLVHATIDAPGVRQPGDQVRVDAGAASTIVASLKDSVAVNLWKPIRLGVRHEDIHLFDLTTGAALSTTEVLV